MKKNQLWEEVKHLYVAKQREEKMAKPISPFG